MKDLKGLQSLANAVRNLAIDMVESANSGHPGAPLGMADVATVLWKEILNYNPAYPSSSNRDRVVLSNGHACAMLYAVLYLAGYPLKIEDLKSFRQINSLTPGHPERDVSVGIDVATGPLGQGVANAVGLALSRDAKKTQAEKNYTVYCFAGDGCLMEGISYEACSLAGTHKLKDLIVLYDSNNISIDGDTDAWFSENISQRFLSQGWQVIDSVDGHDFSDINEALIKAKTMASSGPVLIVFKTEIGRFIPDWAGKAISHGQPLGEERAKKTKEAMGLDSSQTFSIDADVLKAWRSISPSRLTEANSIEKEKPIIDWVALDHWAKQQTQALATRAASFQVMDRLPDVFFGGCADLTSSVFTKYPSNARVVSSNNPGNFLQYGVREFAMCAIANGIAADGHMIPYVGTFLIFSDYAKNAIRMSALMHLQVIYVLTHDSVGLGEDGPTHQPIEQLAMLRATPNLQVWRPCDIEEVVGAWRQAYLSDSAPTCIVLSRQKLPKQPSATLANIEKGAYAIMDMEKPDLILLASGSEVDLACQTANILKQHELSVRVVSMPCMEQFRSQEDAYKQALLPNHITKIAIEAAASQPWYEWVGSNGLVFGIDDFGRSGKGSDVLKSFGLSPDAIAKRVIEHVALASELGENL